MRFVHSSMWLILQGARAQTRCCAYTLNRCLWARTRSALVHCPLALFNFLCCLLLVLLFFRSHCIILFVLPTVVFLFLSHYLSLSLLFNDSFICILHTMKTKKITSSNNDTNHCILCLTHNTLMIIFILFCNIYNFLMPPLTGIHCSLCYGINAVVVVVVVTVLRHSFTL